MAILAIILGVAGFGLLAWAICHDYRDRRRLLREIRKRGRLWPTEAEVRQWVKDGSPQLPREAE